MRKDKVVTIWHFGNSDTPTGKVFKNASVDSACSINKNGIKQKGFFDASGATVRIFTAEEVVVNPGDYLCFGECSDAAVPVENSMKIIAVKDNRRGGQKHWRIVCGG